MLRVYLYYGSMVVVYDSCFSGCLGGLGRFDLFGCLGGTGILVPLCLSGCHTRTYLSTPLCFGAGFLSVYNTAHTFEHSRFVASYELQEEENETGKVQYALRS